VREGCDDPGKSITVFRRPEPHGSTRPPAWGVMSGYERVEAARRLGKVDIEADIIAAPVTPPATAPTATPAVAW
jgi:hypothetical protein